MYLAIFSIIVLFACLVGAIAGIGGGVIIRPVLDAFGYFETAEISNMISTIAVLFGALTAVIIHIVSKSKIENYKIAIFLGVGAAIGGGTGQLVFKLIKESFNSDILIIVQSAILIVLLIFVLIYMQIFFPKEKQLHIKNPVFTVLIGLLLGLISSFLGIGGGPINVAIFLLFFGMTMKQAAINSLITIIFSQVAKLIIACFDGTFATLFAIESLPSVDQTWWIFLLVLVPISIIGSLIGSFLHKRMSDKATQIVYVSTTILIICINIYLVVASSLNLVS